MIQGVRINCALDQEVFAKPQFEAIEVPSNDLIFSEHSTSDIAERIKLPIFTQRCRPSPEWSNGKGSACNQEATFLHLCLDPKSEYNERTGAFGWGWAPEPWIGVLQDVGSVIVVRQDKRPLLPLHAEALCEYCYDHVRPLMEHSKGVYGDAFQLKKEDVLTMICPATFQIFWGKFMTEKKKATKIEYWKNLSFREPYDYV
jgi:hypothetical protein